MRHLAISFLLSEPTPYHECLFKELTHKGNQVNLFYLSVKNERHPWQLEGTIQKGCSITLCLNIRQTLTTISYHLFKRKPDFFIIGGLKDVRLLTTYTLLKLFRVPFALFCDTPQINIRRPFAIEIIRNAMLRWVYRNAAAILTTGHTGIAAFQAMGCPRERLHNLPWCVDPGVPAKVDQSINRHARELRQQYAPQGETLFLCAGQLIARKGYDVAIRALAKALAKEKQGTAMLIAGDGPERKNLEDVVDSLGLSSKVHFLGWRQPREMESIFLAADVLVHPALWDPYPVAVLEAMSWGLPVLASDQTMAAVDRVISGESGFLRRVGDVSGLAEDMAYLLANPQRVKEMGHMARCTAEQWPVSRCAQKVLDLVRS